MWGAVCGLAAEVVEVVEVAAPLDGGQRAGGEHRVRPELCGDETAERRSGRQGSG